MAKNDGGTAGVPTVPGSEMGRAFRAAFPHTVPIWAAFWMLAIAYALLMQSKGYGFPWPVLFSAICFCGSMQFVAVTLLTAIFDPVAAFVLTLMVNARHLFYALSMIEPYRGAGWMKPFMIFTMCDEAFSLCSTIRSPEGIDRRTFCFAVSALIYFWWVSGTVVGCLVGTAVPFDMTGLDFSLTALFIVLFLEQCRERDTRVAALAGLGATAVALSMLGPDRFIIPSMAAIFVALNALRRKRWL